MNKMDHFKAFDFLSALQLESIHKHLDTRNVSSSYNMVTSILSDKARINGNVYKIYRLFVRTHDSSELANVGWILEDNVQICLLCGGNFSQNGLPPKKFHCYACGNLVCENCITAGQLEVLNHNETFVNTCCQCNFGQPNILSGYPYFVRDLYSMKFYTIDQVKPRFTITVRAQNNIEIKINLCTSPLIPYNISIRPNERYIFCGKFDGENVQYDVKVFTIVVNPTMYINKDEHPKLIEAILQFLNRCFDQSFPPTTQYSTSHDHIFFDYHLSPKQNEKVLPSKVPMITMNIPAYEAFYLYIQLPISVGTVFPKDSVMHTPQPLLPTIDLSTSKHTKSQTHRSVKFKKEEKEQIDMTINWGQVLVINDYVSLITRVTGYTLNEEERLRSSSGHNSLSCFHEDYLDENENDNKSSEQPPEQPPLDYTTAFFSFFGFGESKENVEPPSDTVEYTVKLHNHLPSERIQHYQEHYQQQKRHSVKSDGVDHAHDEAVLQNIAITSPQPPNDRIVSIKEEKKEDFIDDAILLSKQRSHSISSVVSFATTTNTITSVTPSLNNNMGIRKPYSSQYPSKVNHINDIVFAIEPKTPQNHPRSPTSINEVESIRSDNASSQVSSAIFRAEAHSQDDMKNPKRKKSIFSSIFNNRSRSSTASEDASQVKAAASVPALSATELLNAPQHRAFYEKLSRLSYSKILKQEFPDAFVVDRKRCLNGGEIVNLKHEATQNRSLLVGLQILLQTLEYQAKGIFVITGIKRTIFYGMVYRLSPEEIGNDLWINLQLQKPPTTCPNSSTITAAPRKHSLTLQSTETVASKASSSSKHSNSKKIANPNSTTENNSMPPRSKSLSFMDRFTTRFTSAATNKSKPDDKAATINKSTITINSTLSLPPQTLLSENLPVTDSIGSTIITAPSSSEPIHGGSITSDIYLGYPFIPLRRIFESTNPLAKKYQQGTN